MLRRGAVAALRALSQGSLSVEVIPSRIPILAPYERNPSMLRCFNRLFSSFLCLILSVTLCTVSGASSVGNELIFLDPITGKIQRTVKDVLDPYQIGFSPDQKWFVSASLRLDRVDIYKYDGTNLALSKRIPLGKLPSHMAFNRASDTVFITRQGSDQVSAIDLKTQEVKWTLTVGKLPAGIAMTPDDKYLLVGIMGADYVEVIDWRAQKTVKRIKAGDGTHNFRSLGDGRHTFVSNRVSNTINIIDQVSLENVGTINVPGGPD